MHLQECFYLISSRKVMPKALDLLSFQIFPVHNQEKGWCYKIVELCFLWESFFLTSLFFFFTQLKLFIIMLFSFFCYIQIRPIGFFLHVHFQKMFSKKLC